MQGILYPQGVINQLLQLMMIFWAGVESVKTFFVQSPIIKSLFYLLFMYCLYGGWIILFGDNVTFSGGGSPADYTYLQTALNSLLPIFMFYSYTRKELLTPRRIVTYTIIFTIIAIASFYKNKYAVLGLSEREEITNNMGYIFVSLIPLVYFFSKKPFLQYTLLALLGTFILMGMKRGAILIGGLSIIAFLYTNLKGVSLKRKMIMLIFSLGIVAIAIYYIADMLQTNDYFVQRIEQTLEGNSSGRDSIYSTLWEAFVGETNILYFLFGRGANATIGIAGNYAHQDWLETLINNGLFGGIILLLFFIYITKTALKQQRRFPTYMYYSFLVLIFITLSNTMFSMSIQDLHIAQSLLIGYFAYWSTRPKEEIENQESTHT